MKFVRKTLLLTQNDIKKLISMEDAIRIIERSFAAYANNEVVMPPKIYLELKKFNGDFRAMPAWIKSFNSCGIKWVCSYPKNIDFCLPTVMAIILLNNPKNAYPVAILEGTYLTNVRTGAAGAVAAKYLAKKDSEILSLIGCGVQAKFQLLALKEVFRIKVVKLYDIDFSKMKKFINEVNIPNVKFVITKNIKECVKEADIICTCTPSRKPLIKHSWINGRVHINAIGADAPGKCELDPLILKSAKIIVDDYAQAIHGGEINVAIKKGIITEKDIYATLGEIVTKKKKVGFEGITVFDSTGLALQDIAIASYVYKKAVKKKIGLWINLF